jgi:hypothetical protein
MLSLEDCLGLCGLSEDELQLVAEHEHVPLIVAAELAAELLRTARGTYVLRGYMLDVLEKAVAAGARDRARRLDRIIAGFISAHPVPPVL